MRSFTFENQGTNTFLVYQLGNEDLIDSFCYGMISNNNIDGIIPILLSQINEDKYLKYNIVSKISLKQYFNGIVNRSRFLNVMKNIAFIMNTCEEYMLKISNIMIDTEHIYVNVSNNEISLIYLPLGNITENISPYNFFKDLTTNIQFDPSENTGYVAQIINFLNQGNNFSLTDFIKLLDKLLEGDLVSKSSSPATYSHSEPTPVVAMHSQPQNMKPVSEVVHNSMPVKNEQQSIYKNQVNYNTIPTAATTEKAENKSGFLNLFKSKDNKQKEPKVKETKIKKNKQNIQKEMPMQNYAIPGQKNTNHTKMNQAEQQSVHNQNLQPIPNKMPTPSPISPVVSNQQPVSAQQYNFGETSVLSNNMIGETTVLGQENYNQPSQAYMIRQKTNEKILIHKAIFNIGKEQNYVDYFIADNPSISRSHATIICREGQYYLVDTNSMNKTYINNQMIDSNVEVMITNGTKFRLANEEFEFVLQ